MTCETLVPYDLCVTVDLNTLLNLHRVDLNTLLNLNKYPLAYLDQTGYQQSGHTVTV